MDTVETMDRSQQVCYLVTSAQLTLYCQWRYGVFLCPVSTVKTYNKTIIMLHYTSHRHTALHCPLQW